MSTLIDFDALSDEELQEIDLVQGPRKNKVIRQQVSAPAPTVSVTVTPVNRPSKPSTHLLKSEEQWDWRQLRDYVVTQIEAIHGTQPRDALKEKAIFSGFINRWGAKAPLIAKAAFNVHGGVWKSAPISVNRFCKASDPFFSEPIAERLQQP